MNPWTRAILVVMVTIFVVKAFASLWGKVKGNGARFDLFVLCVLAFTTAGLLVANGLERVTE